MSMKDLPAAAWSSIFRWTAIFAVVSVAASVLASHALLSSLGNGLSLPGLAASALLPVLIGGPMSFWHLVRLQQLKLANRKLEVLASTDWLTACLNRRAFTDTLAGQRAGSDRLHPARGTLLAIDADNFKVINDLFGHHHGDEALQLMAEVIRAKVRQGDLVCRMGGEEFGVYLDGADRETAGLIAERIRRGIATATFTPGGTQHPLSVSIGGAVFEGNGIEFTELFRLADRNLYAAKQAGRNRCEIGTTEQLPEPARDTPQLRLAEAG